MPNKAVVFPCKVFALVLCPPVKFCCVLRQGVMYGLIIVVAVVGRKSKKSTWSTSIFQDFALLFRGGCSASTNLRRPRSAQVGLFTTYMCNLARTLSHLSCRNSTICIVHVVSVYNCPHCLHQPLRAATPESFTVLQPSASATSRTTTSIAHR